MEKTEQIVAISTGSIGYYIVSFLIMFDRILVIMGSDSALSCPFMLIMLVSM